jgi:hypothetical protein
MAKQLFGLETEYAFTALDAQGQSVDREATVDQLMHLARSTLPHLPDMHSSGMFLQNGSRFYVDAGPHPEFCTPECTTPWDAVRYVLAGEKILARLAVELEYRNYKISEALFFKCNVDYTKRHTTWGCHESYLHHVDPALLPGQILPHLVSRIIYTGAGGCSSGSQGLEFTLSPRVNQLVTVVSNDSTHNRGIFHTKNESLSGRYYNRMHILCGESLGSQLAIWLKIGVTALVVAMVEAGLRPGESVQLGAPLEAMRLFARDAECKAEAQGKDGQPLTAIAIQRHYLDLAVAHVHDSFMPAWAAEVCREWGRVLDLLEAGSPALETMLDWQIKLALFKDRIVRRGLNWETVAQWTQLLGALTAAPRGKTADDDTDLLSELVAVRKSRIGDQVKKLAPSIKARGLRTVDLTRFLTLRQELFEIDTRYGQLGARGIFATLDRAGMLNHHVSGVDDIYTAVTSAPSTSRARLRGEWISRLAGKPGRSACDWQILWDDTKRQALDLTEPFEYQERWVSLPRNENGKFDPFEELIPRLRQAT